MSKNGENFQKYVIYDIFNHLKLRYNDISGK